jgi:hypothetical protein
LPDSVINLLIQLPIVGIFVFFILEWSRRIERAQIALNEQWREFLKEERAHRAEAIGRLAEEIKFIAQQVNHLNGLLSAHDARSQVRAEQGRGTGQLHSRDKT